MTDHQVTLTLSVSVEQFERLEARAHELGFSNSSDYVLALIEELEDAVEGFREGWHDVMTGNTFPASSIWEDLGEE